MPFESSLNPSRQRRTRNVPMPVAVSNVPTAGRRIRSVPWWTGVAVVEICARAVAAASVSTTARAAGFHIGFMLSQRNDARGMSVSAGERADVGDQVPERAGILEYASV